MKIKLNLLIVFTAIDCSAPAQSPKAYTTNYGEDYISVIEIIEKVADIQTGEKPYGIAGAPNGKTIAVSNEDSHTVSINNAVTSPVAPEYSAKLGLYRMVFRSTGAVGDKIRRLSKRGSKVRVGGITRIRQRFQKSDQVTFSLSSELFAALDVSGLRRTHNELAL
ncbi:MAG: hypothetical protein R2828_19685 [Saprospiraceae bacterium]